MTYLLPRSALVPFPLSLHRGIVADLVDRFLNIRPGPDRALIFRRTELARLTRRRRALGLPIEAVEAEVLGVEHAVAARLASICGNQGAAE